MKKFVLFAMTGIFAALLFTGEASARRRVRVVIRPRPVIVRPVVPVVPVAPAIVIVP